MRLAVVGTGYVGLVAGVCFAESGNDVVCVDKDATKVRALRAGRMPIYEPGLEELLRRNIAEKRLTFTTALPKAVKEAAVVFIAVGTPQGEDGSADLQHVLEVARQIGRAMNGYTVIVNKSTVPVGTSERVRGVVARETRHPFAVVSNPEFLKQGAAVDDFMKPDRVVIGADDPKAAALMQELYAPFTRTDAPIMVMDCPSAELSKYAANAMLATRISFMNEMANLAERLGADVEAVRRGIGADPRIGPKFLFPGPGFGGSCFPKDLKALLYLGQRAGVPLAVVHAADQANDRQKTVVGSKIVSHLGDVAGKTIAVWGLAFKPKTDDIRESPALVLVETLLGLGAKVRAHDPEAMANVRAQLGDRVTLVDSMYDACEGADALALLTEWHEYRRPDFARLHKLLRHAVVFDGRNIWDPGELRGLGFSYHGIGRP
jgi:UDPglucose 6-dehydrogenase